MTINIPTAIMGKMTSPYNSKPPSRSLASSFDILGDPRYDAIPDMRPISAINNILSRIITGTRHALLTIVMNDFAI